MMPRSLRATLILILASGMTQLPASAQLASRPAEEWIKMLDAPARVAGLKVDEIIARLELKPGVVVADLGAGSGVFSVPLARAVGPSGKVYAVEIDHALLEHINGKVKEQNVTNVHTVLGKFGDPSLPAADVDVAFMHDVLHHIEDRAEYLKNVARYLKPGGRLAIVEPDARTGPHRNDPKLQVTKEQLNAWMADSGFVPSNEPHLFDNKWYVIYVRK
jgi:ubiquinone/menaquinone biosynthesis C-methylase UbiE